MNSINELLGRNKVKAPEKVSEKAPEKPLEKKKSFSLNLGSKKETPVEKEILLKESDPFSSLENALNSLNKTEMNLGEEKEEIFTKDPKKQFESPTLDDVSKFVFDEQIDETDSSITEMFSTMLDELKESTGDLVPENLARNLLFIKAHPFLAEILKPESISTLVTAMRKSYGYIVSVKTDKSKKKAIKNAKVSDVMDSLSDFTF